MVPIIENTPFEEDLTDRLEQAIKDYPHTCAVLVRRHGVRTLLHNQKMNCVMNVKPIKSFPIGRTESMKLILSGLCMGRYVATG